MIDSSLYSAGLNTRRAKLNQPVSPLSPEVYSFDFAESGLTSNLAGQKQPPV